MELESPSGEAGIFLIIACLGAALMALELFPNVRRRSGSRQQPNDFLL